MLVSSCLDIVLFYRRFIDKILSLFFQSRKDSVCKLTSIFLIYSSEVIISTVIRDSNNH